MAIVTSTGELHLLKARLPASGPARTFRVLLPKDYHHSDRRYPVIYALDGQNLFEASTAFGGRHWKVPETLSKMPKRLQTIVVGIDNAGAGRLNEYAPYRRNQQGGGGEAHLRLIVTSVKPLVDSTFRTNPAAHETAMIGSSMGGLLALYAGLRFGETFGKIGVLSPSLWFNPQVLELAGTSDRITSKFYVSGSKTESTLMANSLQSIYWALRKAGLDDRQLQVVIRDRGKHNEVFWGREFPKMHKWLFS